MCISACSPCHPGSGACKCCCEPGDPTVPVACVGTVSNVYAVYTEDVARNHGNQDSTTHMPTSATNNGAGIIMANPGALENGDVVTLKEVGCDERAGAENCGFVDDECTVISNAGTLGVEDGHV